MIKDEKGGTGGRSYATPAETALAEDFGKTFDLDFDGAIRVVRARPKKLILQAIYEVKRATQEEGLSPDRGESLTRDKLRRIGYQYTLEIDYDKT